MPHRAFRHRLEPPRGRHGAFDWHEYLAETRSVAAPDLSMNAAADSAAVGSVVGACAASVLLPVVQCRSGHPLEQYTSLGGSCDICGQGYGLGTVVHDCRKCKYWLCAQCHGIAQQSLAAAAPKAQTPLTTADCIALKKGTQVVLLSAYELMPPYVEAGTVGIYQEMCGSDPVVTFPEQGRTGACPRPDQLALYSPPQKEKDGARWFRFAMVNVRDSGFNIRRYQSVGHGVVGKIVKGSTSPYVNNSILGKLPFQSCTRTRTRTNTRTHTHTPPTSSPPPPLLSALCHCYPLPLTRTTTTTTAIAV